MAQRPRRAFDFFFVLLAFLARPLHLTHIELVHCVIGIAAKFRVEVETIAAFLDVDEV